MENSIVKNFEETHQKVIELLTDYVSGGYIETLAKLLIYMGKNQAEEILAKMPEPFGKLLGEAYKNFSDKKINDPEIIAAAMRILKDKDFYGKPLCESVSENLSSSEKDELLSSTNELFERDPLIALSVEKHLVCFDVLVDIDDRSTQKLLRELDNETLAKALIDSSDVIQEKIFRNMSKRAACLLKEDIEFMGPIRKTDVNAARDEVIKKIITLVKEGEIVIGSYWA